MIGKGTSGSLRSSSFAAEWNTITSRMPAAAISSLRRAKDRRLQVADRAAGVAAELHVD
jgi:hypothetical protein